MAKPKTKAPKQLSFKPQRSTRTVLSALLYAGGFDTAYTAALAEISPVYLRAVASGSVKPSPAVLARIAAVCDVQHTPAKLLEPVKSIDLIDAVRVMNGLD